MQTKLKVAAASAAVLLGGFAVVGATNASATPSPVKPATTSVTTADPDTLQQGDQTTPDKPGSADKETTDAAGTESANENAPESGTANDGPGGHADGPGNVDHQFEGQE